MYSSPQNVHLPPLSAPLPHSRTVAPETFLLDQNAQQSLPPDAILALQQVDNLKYFLISAPVDWSPDQYIRRFLLPTGEYISCVLWNNLFHISGTDIVRCLSFRFQAFGRPVKNSKKFEEGVFSDLRNLKAGTDASLEDPKSPFLDFLYKNNCIRTQKKQKVFFWYSVPHDRLFLDALERDLKREKMGHEATTVAVAEPALSFEFDSSQSLFEQLTKAQQANSSAFNSSLTSALAPGASLRTLDPSSLLTHPLVIPSHSNGFQQVTGLSSSDASPAAPVSASSNIPSQSQSHQSLTDSTALSAISSYSDLTLSTSPSSTIPPQSLTQTDSADSPNVLNDATPEPAQMLPLSTTQTNPATTASLTSSVSAVSQTPSIPAIDVSYERDVPSNAAAAAHLYTRNGVSFSQVHHRHSSVPTFMEYSPAPSFVSSQMEDYSSRGISYEPLTPPQHYISSLSSDPVYISNEDTNLYSGISDLSVPQHNYNSLTQIPSSNIAALHYPQVPRAAFAPSNVFSVLEGSPTYKQRRRRFSLSCGSAPAASASASNIANPHLASNAVAAAVATATAPTNHRLSELRRSMSLSVAPVPEADEGLQEQSPHALSAPYGSSRLNSSSSSGLSTQDSSVLEYSNATALGPALASNEFNERSPIAQQQLVSSNSNGTTTLMQLSPQDEQQMASLGMSLSLDMTDSMMMNGNPLTFPSAGVYRRAKSVAMPEMGPYPQKSHSCPIPTCGRLFKRLEHLKRHVRTHTQERPYVCNLCSKAFSRSDNLSQHRRTHEQQHNGETLQNFSEEENATEESQTQSQTLSQPQVAQHVTATNVGMTEQHQHAAAAATVDSSSFFLHGQA